MNILRQLRKQGMLAALMALVVFTSIGQGINRGQNEQVTIRGSYDPTINQAFKINGKPELFSPTLQEQTFSFESIKVEQPTKVSLEPIEAERVRADQKTETFNNFLKAGIGSWISPYLEFAHSSGSDDTRFDASLYHLSSFLNIPDYSPSPNSDTRLNLDLETSLNDHVFSVGAGYGLKTTRYYGFRPDDYPNFPDDNDKLKQSFNLAEANIGIRSNYRNENRLHHQFDVSAYYYFDRYKTTETNARFDFNLFKAFSVSKMLNFQHLGFEGKFDYFGNKDSLQSNTSFLAEGMPYFKAKYGIVSFVVGLKFAFAAADEDDIFAFNPVVKADFNLIPEGLTLYMGVDGGLEKNSYLKLSSVNPWMASDTLLRWQNNRFDVFGGIRGNIARQVGFNLMTRYITFKNMAFFINTSESSLMPLNKFNVEYDNGEVFNFSGELTYTSGGDFKLWLKGEYNMYTMDSLNYAYHKPLSFAKLGGSYLFMEKIKLSIEALAYGKRYAVDNEIVIKPTEIILPGFFDLNLGLSYAITDDFQIWLTGTNLLNKRYQRFYNYPVQGIEIMGGIGLRF